LLPAILCFKANDLLHVFERVGLHHEQGVFILVAEGLPRDEADFDLFDISHLRLQ
jgi:hypothetical protein